MLYNSFAVILASEQEELTTNAIYFRESSRRPIQVLLKEKMKLEIKLVPHPIGEPSHANILLSAIVTIFFSLFDVVKHATISSSSTYKRNIEEVDVLINKYREITANNNKRVEKPRRPFSKAKERGKTMRLSLFTPKTVATTSWLPKRSTANSTIINNNNNSNSVEDNVDDNDLKEITSRILVLLVDYIPHIHCEPRSSGSNTNNIKNCTTIDNRSNNDNVHTNIYTTITTSTAKTTSTDTGKRSKRKIQKQSQLENLQT
ncbi:tubulin-specific chaperone C-like [Octopus bimaculoides]|uniref:tubulin-specific chaperone C-like n=1 Tax=Octopus bimaculoides TaxID=37653 RepID=UPI00071CD833|nr:tubulin-specific chaperone C-like [Octopus bimaculoides]|eukprot:XP_014774423.1 PREDICTED: tubulin-specific chaperone C-like [Octopus bimaculoides]